MFELFGLPPQALVGMQSSLTAFGQWVTVSQSVILVICVLLFRRGIVGEIAGFVCIKR